MPRRARDPAGLPEEGHVRLGLPVVGLLGEGRDEAAVGVLAGGEFAHALQGSELDAGHRGLVAQVQALPRVAVAPASGEQGFDDHQALELARLPGLLDPLAQHVTQDRAAVFAQVLVAQDLGRGLRFADHVLERRHLLAIVVGGRERAGAAAAQVVDRAIATDAEQVLLEGEERVERGDAAHRAQEDLLHDVLARLRIIDATRHVGVQSARELALDLHPFAIVEGPQALDVGGPLAHRVGSVRFMPLIRPLAGRPCQPA